MLDVAFYFVPLAIVLFSPTRFDENLMLFAV